MSARAELRGPAAVRDTTSPFVTVDDEWLDIGRPVTVKVARRYRCTESISGSSQLPDTW